MNTLKNRNLKVLSTLLLCAFAFLGFAQTKKNFIINGSFMNMKVMPSKVYLSYDPISGKPADSTVVKNGKYIFKGEVDAVVPGFLSLDLNPSSEKITLMLDNGILNVSSDQKVDNFKVSGTGSKATEEFRKVNSFSAEESAAIKKLMNSEAYKTDDSVKKEVSTRSSKLLGNALMNVISYIRKNPSSSVSPFFTYGLLASGFLTPQMADTLMQTFPPELKKTSIGKGIEGLFAKREASELEAAAKRKALENLIPVGSKALEFTQNDVNGKAVSLSSFKGKYVLIDFWASWCMPCRAENPNVVKAYEAFKNKNFTVLGVSLDAASFKGKWLEAIEKDGLSWTQVSDLKGGNNAVAKLYHVEYIPQNFLVNPDGIIIAKNLRGEELEKKLAELIK